MSIIISGSNKVKQSDTKKICVYMCVCTCSHTCVCTCVKKGTEWKQPEVGLSEKTCL